MQPNHPSPSDRPAADERIDARLRSSLSPEPATVERLTRTALAETAPRSRLPAAWRLAAAGLVAALTIAVAWLRPATPPRSIVSPAPPAPEPVAVVISNASGLLTVTTAAGSKMVVLPKVAQPGDAS